MYTETSKDTETVASPYVGMGGTTRLRYPHNLVINSFREWDHYHEPGTGETDTLPTHRFWTWGKMDRPAWTPAGECMPGNWVAPHSQEVLDGIHECDIPILDETINRYPGAMHQVGNEPNFGPYVSPKDYAYQFSLYEQHIHSIDPTAQMLSGGITLPVAWESWTIDFIQENPAVDVWVIHPYPSKWPDGEVCALESIEYVKAFREMLDSNGYMDKPLILGEFSDAYGGNPVHELAEYAAIFCDWIITNQDNYNVVGWYWWGSSSVAMGNAGLFDEDRNITPVGEAYMAHCGIREHRAYMPLVIKQKRSNK